MTYFRACVDAMSAYVPGEQPAANSRVIKLNTNENPYPPSPRVVEAIVAELGNGERLRLYSDPSASRLREAASRVTGVSAERILAGNGSDELLSMILRAMVEPGESVAYPYPSYILYETLAAAQGAHIDELDYPPDFALPRALFGSKAKVVFVTTPNSPSGVSHRFEELGELAASLKGGVLVVDEAYVDFAEAGALDLVERFNNVIVTRTLSKSYSLAGMRIGLLFAAPSLIEGLSKIKDSYNLDRLAIAAGAAALEDGDWMLRHVERIRATRRRLASELERLGFQVLPSEANFVFARCGSRERAREIYASLKSRGILVRYFERALLDDGLRITVGTDEETDVFLRLLNETT